MAFFIIHYLRALGFMAGLGWRRENRHEPNQTKNHEANTDTAHTHTPCCKVQKCMFFWWIQVSSNLCWFIFLFGFFFSLLWFPWTMGRWGMAWTQILYRIQQCGHSHVQLIIANVSKNSPAVERQWENLVSTYGETKCTMAFACLFAVVGGAWFVRNPIFCRK